MMDVKMDITEEDFSGLNKLLEELDSGYYADIGVLGAGSDMHPESDDTIAAIGAKHEYGVVSQGLPARSFIFMPLTLKADDIQKAAEAQFDKDPTNVKGVFKIIGIAGEKASKEAFETRGYGQWAPLSENYETRPSGKPVTDQSRVLVDTGLLQNSITSKVGNNGSA